MPPPIHRTGTSEEARRCEPSSGGAFVCLTSETPRGSYGTAESKWSSTEPKTILHHVPSPSTPYFASRRPPGRRHCSGAIGTGN